MRIDCQLMFAMYGMKHIIKLVMIYAILTICLAIQAQAQTITTPLYPEEPITSVDTTMTSGNTWYVFFQALANVKVVSLSVFGEPVDYNQNSEYRWQLFKTTSDWQTPNGNDDRLFYTGQIYFQDIGRGEYTAGIEEGLGAIFHSDVLEAGSYYRLSFQISNVSFLAPVNRILPPVSFVTIDGLFLMLGASGLSFPAEGIGPYLQISITTIPVSLLIDIDIKPGSDRNPIDPNSRDVIPVVILTTDTFDATRVDPLSVEFGPNGATDSETTPCRPNTKY